MKKPKVYKRAHYIDENGYYRWKTINNNLSIDNKGWLHSFDDKPADYSYEWSEEWYKHGRLHRLTGPARIWFSMYEFWIEGKQIFNKEEFEIKANRILMLGEI